MWQLKRFSKLTPNELYDIFYARIQTFVVDQNRIYQEVDEQDKAALHLMDYENGRLVAYARIFTEEKHVTFGRVLSIPEVRGQGYGRLLLEQIMQVLNDHFSDLPVEIEAQEQVQGLYTKFGFHAVGDVFLFNHTPHIKMVHEPLATTHATQLAAHQGRE
ncbi:GNAT family N-acetyltransferase [Furfurilactobacillus milii]|uniref:GNAT family N-acetyltransferase n=1 Tax=Furfurilactobacillus milii TaxID=2888272 RepID=A0A6N9I668_9LACO|nr:GNAT family N-acetyltransferase [Furfurilactobacillus milii]MYV18204.1 GNAT family N-acetyltransferase [Furfurilactobacillus milii]